MAEIVKFDDSAIMALASKASAIGSAEALQFAREVLSLRREVRQESAKLAYYEALVGLQADMPSIAKSKVVMNRDGRTERYRYAPLAEINRAMRPAWQKWGFAVTFSSAEQDGQILVRGIATHREGHSESSEMRSKPLADQYMSEPQRMIATKSYLMRAITCDLFGIVAEDDIDGGSPPTAPTASIEDAREAMDLVRKIEERIDEHGLDRERVLEWMRKATGVPVLGGLSVTQARRVLAKVESIAAEASAKAEAFHAEEKEEF